MELVQDTKVLLVYQQCDKCKEGFMEEEEEDVMLCVNNPNSYLHKCNKCGYTERYSKFYPYQMLVPVGAVREMTKEEKGL